MYCRGGTLGGVNVEDGERPDRSVHRLTPVQVFLSLISSTEKLVYYFLDNNNVLACFSSSPFFLSKVRALTVLRYESMFQLGQGPRK